MGQTRVTDGRDYVAEGLRYAEEVVAGQRPACRWVRAACQRQLDDLRRQGTPGFEYTFNLERAWRICYFIEQLPHVKGRWKTPRIYLEPHQCFRFCTVFGWEDGEGCRRFRKSLTVVPRKNAKTTEAAGVGLYLFALDKEPGAEVYAAAVTKDQVAGPSGVWTIARRMLLRSPSFMERYGITVHVGSLAIEGEGAAFKPLARDANPNEGLNIHGAIIDELHAHKTREIFDVIDDGTGARRQPLLYIISTEGDNAAGVFAEQVAYAEQILSGRHEDDSYFAIIYTIDPEDDWTDPAAWAKANPNLGVSVFAKDLEFRCRQAQKNPASQSSFLTKRLNVRVGAGDAYFNLLAWRTICRDDTLRLEDFYGEPCILSLDLASKIDIAAKLYTFERDGKEIVFGKFYLPEDALDKGNPNYDIYRGWAEREILTMTPGAIIDFAFIEEDLLADARNFDVHEIAYDPHQATQLSTRMLAEGLPMIEVPQTVLSLSEPMKDLAAQIMAGGIRHDGNPALEWMIGNVIAKVDAKDNVYPRKAREENKIDGAVALIMAKQRRFRFEDNSYANVRAM